MDIFQIAGLGIVASVVLMLIRKERPELSLGLTLVVGLMLFFMILPRLSSVVTVFGELATESGLEPLYFGIILKVLAISYVADLGASICRDAGEELIATRVEMAGKVLILVSALPIVQEVLNVIRALMV
ncbi:MAG: stage III sporulation protein AD [Bacillota bacterium]